MGTKTASAWHRHDAAALEGRFVIATRSSELALWQANHVASLIRAAFPALQVELACRTTLGDRRRDRSLAEFGGEGVFSSDLEEALLAGECDCCVHSLKDLPTSLPEGLVLGAVPTRGDVRDALVSLDAMPLPSLASGSRVGTGSLRRRAQIAAMRPDLELVDIRGNLDTRVGFVDAGALDAVVVAYAGLSRLGMAWRASQVFDASELLPAAGQGAIAVEIRAGDTRAAAICSQIADPDSARDVWVEREVLRKIGGGCRLPFGVYARVEQVLDVAGKGRTPSPGQPLLRLVVDAGVFSAGDGDAVRAHQVGAVEDAAAIAARVANMLVAGGARDLLAM